MLLSLFLLAHLIANFDEDNRSVCSILRIHFKFNTYDCFNFFICLLTCTSYLYLCPHLDVYLWLWRPLLGQNLPFPFLLDFCELCQLSVLWFINS